VTNTATNTAANTAARLPNRRAFLSLLAATAVLGPTARRAPPAARREDRERGLRRAGRLDRRPGDRLAQVPGRRRLGHPAELAADLGYLQDLKLDWVGNTISGPQDIQSAATRQTDFGGAFNGAVVKLVAAGARSPP